MKCHADIGVAFPQTFKQVYPIFSSAAIDHESEFEVGIAVCSDCDHRYAGLVACQGSTVTLEIVFANAALEPHRTVIQQGQNLPDYSVLSVKEYEGSISFPK